MEKFKQYLAKFNEFASRPITVTLGEEIVTMLIVFTIGALLV